MNYSRIISKLIALYLCGIFLLVTLFTISCSQSKDEISIEKVDEVVYARYDSSVPGSGYSYKSSFMEYNVPISFDVFDEGSNNGSPTRSYCYAKFNITFNNTLSGYTAYEMYTVTAIQMDNKDISYRLQAGSSDKDIEIIIWLRYVTASGEHTINSLTYTQFDSVLGEDVEYDYELNYTFTSQTIDNWVSRISGDYYFEATSTALSQNLLTFTVDTNIEYDKLIYNVDMKGTYADSSKWISLADEETLDKTEVYIYTSDLNLYYWYAYFQIVGYQKDNVNYYFTSIGFSLRN